jgi:hypothetical protein
VVVFVFEIFVSAYCTKPKTLPKTPTTTNRLGISVPLH